MLQFLSLSHVLCLFACFLFFDVCTVSPFVLTSAKYHITYFISTYTQPIFLCFSSPIHSIHILWLEKLIKWTKQIEHSEFDHCQMSIIIYWKTKGNAHQTHWTKGFTVEKLKIFNIAEHQLQHRIKFTISLRVIAHRFRFGDFFHTPIFHTVFSSEMRFTFCCLLSMIMAILFYPLSLASVIFCFSSL